jgi:alpha-N-acetylglucosamine transferase
MKIILGIAIFVFISFWLAIIIGVGVNSGIKAFYRDYFQNKKEDKNESI